MPLVVQKQRLRPSLLYDLPPCFRQYGSCLEMISAQIQTGRDKSRHVSAQRRRFVQFCKTGVLDDVIAMFAQVSHEHILVWNAIIQAHSCRGSHHKILAIFNQMLQEGVMPNKVTFSCVLSACTVLLQLSQGVQVHACIHCSKLRSNIIVTTALIDMHGKCGSMESALLLFDSLLERDVVVFNAMMTCLLKCEEKRDIFRLFNQMLEEGVMPTRVTYITLVEACASLADGELVYCRIFSSHEHHADVSLGNAFIHMYGRCNHPSKAEQLFFRIQKWDIVSWNTLMGVYYDQGDINKVLEHFILMHKNRFSADECTYITLLSSCANAKAFYEGMCIHTCVICSQMESNIGVSTALLRMYGRCGNVADALEVFNTTGAKSLVSLNIMIAVCAQQGNYEEAIHLFNEMMEDGIQPDKVTFVHMTSAYSNAGLFVKGKRLCLLAFKIGYEIDPIVGSSLVNMYGKCGELEDALTIFFQISILNVYSWNVVLKIYACHGDGEGMFRLFNQLEEEGFVPDDVTFVAVLSACDHLGDISKGIFFFKFMQELFGVVPGVAHYVCIIDLLGRTGQLETAACIIDVIPILSDGACIMALASAYHGYVSQEAMTAL
ncbi:hypothetical protein GOP47_0026886 [Adiantum capillus-veneris]|nr:hypothetical protein GOP47_0026235 [Adiantum capillus-veneris]KAI5058716.1 hypothetical protein GOP47_0026886 [Adiantum capillus-veneris]